MSYGFIYLCKTHNSEGKGIEAIKFDMISQQIIQNVIIFYRSLHWKLCPTEVCLETVHRPPLRPETAALSVVPQSHAEGSPQVSTGSTNGLAQLLLQFGRNILPTSSISCSQCRRFCTSQTELWIVSAVQCIIHCVLLLSSMVQF